MGKASSTKKVARAARAGGNRGAGQRRNLGFPAAIIGVVILGLLLIVITRNDRISNAAPRVNTGTANDDHWHVPYDTYTCVPDASTPVTPPTTTPSTVPATGDSTTTTLAPASGSSLGAGSAAGHLGLAQTPTSVTTTTTAPAGTTDSTTTTTTAPTTDTTAPAASTTTTVIAQPGDVPGVFQAPFKDVTKDVAGIHTHGDGVMHIHPFNSGAAGRNAQLRVFLDQVGVTLTDESLSFADPATGQLLTYKEGTTKCQGGKDGIVQVGLWDKVEDAANGLPPNQVITSGLGAVRLRNGHALTIAFLPRDSRIPIQPDVLKRFQSLTDLTPSTTAPAATDSSSSSSGEPSSSSSSAGTSSSSSDPAATTASSTTVPSTTAPN